MGDDLTHMQQQAAHRVRQMQAHARQVLAEREGLDIHPTAPPAPAPRLYNRPPQSEPPPPPAPPTASDNEGLFSLLSRLDAEQWMLLGLALLLFRCGGYTELVLALCYLAL
ncbi:MAG: hypothetical protein IIW40_02610 [Clostridia bacterium]|nr:hypothetical protein [Clostridia bacterium]